MKIKRALISVSDKTGLEALVKGLDKLGVEIISTGGTRKTISSLGVKVKDISEFTGFPEMLDGRVKTLHPKVHGGLLALRDNEEHLREARDHGIEFIDMVVVNLYPFAATVSKPGVTLGDAIENIDIGGPSMLRSAAKNYRFVAVVSDPGQYDGVLRELNEKAGELSDETRLSLAVDVYRRTSEYDGMISSYLSGVSSGGEGSFPGALNLSYSKIKDLRYGENPHQKAAFYKDAGRPASGLAAAKQLGGKELSFNNLLDLNAALAIVSEFAGPAAVVVKHGNPCGAAESESLETAYMNALDCDRLSAFGGIMGFNRKIDGAMAKFILKEADFVECMIAPGYDKDALEALSVKKNLRVLELAAASMAGPAAFDAKRVAGGLLVQDADTAMVSAADLKVVTAKAPDTKLMASLLFAWKVAKHVRSNAIVLAEGTKTVGIGAGQMSRVDSVMIAVRKAAARSSRPVLASDAFFPKADSIEEAHKAGVAAMIQPGGSIRDAEVISACDRFGIPMVFTVMRHFKH